MFDALKSSLKSNEDYKYRLLVLILTIFTVGFCFKLFIKILLWTSLSRSNELSHQNFLRADINRFFKFEIFPIIEKPNIPTSLDDTKTNETEHNDLTCEIKEPTYDNISTTKHEDLKDLQPWKNTSILTQILENNDLERVFISGTEKSGISKFITLITGKSTGEYGLLSARALKLVNHTISSGTLEIPTNDMLVLESPSSVSAYTATAILACASKEEILDIMPTIDIGKTWEALGQLKEKLVERSVMKNVHIIFTLELANSISESDLLLAILDGLVGITGWKLTLVFLIDGIDKDTSPPDSVIENLELQINAKLRMRTQTSSVNFGFGSGQRTADGVISTRIEDPLRDSFDGNFSFEKLQGVEFNSEVLFLTRPVKLKRSLSKLFN